MPDGVQCGECCRLFSNVYVLLFVRWVIVVSGIASLVMVVLGLVGGGRYDGVLGWVGGRCRGWCCGW